MLKSQSLKQEPFIKIPSSSEISKIENSERISINQQRRQSIKFDFFKTAYDFLSDSEIEGDYFEFGCHKARTFRMAMSASEFYNFKNTRFLLLTHFLDFHLQMNWFWKNGKKEF